MFPCRLAGEHSAACEAHAHSGKLAAHDPDPEGAPVTRSCPFKTHLFRGFFNAACASKAESRAVFTTISAASIQPRKAILRRITLELVA